MERLLSIKYLISDLGIGKTHLDSPFPGLKFTPDSSPFVRCPLLSQNQLIPKEWSQESKPDHGRCQQQSWAKLSYNFIPKIPFFTLNPAIPC